MVNVSATEEGEGVVVVPRGELEPWERKEGPKGRRGVNYWECRDHATLICWDSVAFLCRRWSELNS